MKTKVLAGLMVFLIAGTIAFAQPGPRHGRNSDGQNRWNMQSKLGLTDEQQTKIDALRTEHFKATQNLRDQLNEKQVKLDNLLNDNEINSKEVEKMVNEIGKVKTELMQQRINHRIEVRNLLTDEQKVKFDMMGRHQGYRQSGRHW